MTIKSLESLIDDARREYTSNEMNDPVLLDGTSEMHARNALNHLLNNRWDEALNEVRIAAEQRSRWQRFLNIVTRIHETAPSSQQPEPRKP